MGIKTALVDEFNNELKELGKLELGSDKYKVAVDGVTKLADRITEIEKLDDSRAEKKHQELALSYEQDLKREQLESEKKDRVAKNWIMVGTAVFSAAVYGLAFIASTNFEREGTFTTEGGKNSIRQLLKIKI